MDVAKPCVCDTWQRLHAWCCGDSLDLLCQGGGWLWCVRSSGVESPTGEGESPVAEDTSQRLGCFAPSSSGSVESAVNLPGPPGKPKYLV